MAEVMCYSIFPFMDTIEHNFAWKSCILFHLSKYFSWFYMCFTYIMVSTPLSLTNLSIHLDMTISLIY